MSDLRLADQFHADGQPLPLLYTQSSSGRANQRIFDILQLEQVHNDVDISEFLLYLSFSGDVFRYLIGGDTSSSLTEFDDIPRA